MRHMQGRVEEGICLDFLFCFLQILPPLSSNEIKCETDLGGGKEVCQLLAVGNGGGTHTLALVFQKEKRCGKRLLLCARTLSTVLEVSSVLVLKQMPE